MRKKTDRAIPLRVFEPLLISRTVLKNRIVMAPTYTLMDVASDRARAYYSERARGGVGTLIVEGTDVESFRSKSFIGKLRKLSNEIHKFGAAAIIQLSQSDVLDGGKVTVSTASLEQVERIIDNFAVAALGAEEAGFDGAEIHGAHRYLYSQFFSPRHNHRVDSYGASLEGRMRLGIDCLKAMRERVSSDFLLFYRHTPEETAREDLLEDGEFVTSPVKDGYTLEETLQFVQGLEQNGLDVIDISPSTRRNGVHAGLAGEVKQAVRIPVVAVGGMNVPEVVEKTLEEGRADLAAICRGLLADPFWVEKVKDHREEEIIECIRCNSCLNNLFDGIPISCTQNPRTGFEYLDAN